MLILKILFWISVFAMFHSYVLYPFILKILSMGMKKESLDYGSSDEQPEIVILLSAYNEIKVIEEKLDSIYNTNYDLNKVHLFVGSDGSDDGTDEIIEGFQSSQKNVHFYKLGGRSGKSNVLNFLMDEIDSKISSTEDFIAVMTDANVIFTPELFHELTADFKDKNIGIVAANIINRKAKKNGISKFEKSYISHENKIKYREGLLWGHMMGAFGACYAIRYKLLPRIPANYLMEDFYITMNVLRRGLKAIKNPSATAFEDLPDSMNEEFKRKTRISAGNFQNLNSYKDLLWPPSTLAFSFISHKVLRWLGPIFIIVSFLSAFILMFGNKFYGMMFFCIAGLLLIPVLNWILEKLRIRSSVLNAITYFIMMNLALLKGLILYNKGIKTNAWQPTERNV